MKGLMNYLCWHIYGIINRNERNYVEATKCYNKALSLEPENLIILKDLANL